jgi:hypothetical protein
VSHLGRRRPVERLVVGKQRVERVAVDESLSALEAVCEVADRAAALAGERKRRSRRAGGCAVVGSVAAATLQVKSLTSAACTLGATSSIRTG